MSDDSLTIDGDTPKRFSDAELTELSKKVDVIDGKVNAVIKRLDQHEADESKKFGELFQVITENTNSHDRLEASTSTLIKIQEDLEATIRVGKNVQSFALWLLKWGAVGAGTWAIIDWSIQLFER